MIPYSFDQLASLLMIKIIDQIHEMASRLKKTMGGLMMVGE